MANLRTEPHIHRGHKFDVDQQAVSDCALSATMLSGAVENSLKGITTKCNYECDTEFGCDYCIPKGIVAAPAESREKIEGSIDLQIDWIADTGSAQDLVSQGELPDDYGYYSSNPIRMMTANGESSSMKQGKVFVPRLCKTVDPYLVKSTPAVLSVGMRCIDDGYDFIWKGSKGEDPYFIGGTAQGGGGSFKNRKPIGEVGCCESGMAKRIH